MVELLTAPVGSELILKSAPTVSIVAVPELSAKRIPAPASVLSNLATIFVAPLFTCNALSGEVSPIPTLPEEPSKVAIRLLFTYFLL